MDIAMLFKKLSSPLNEQSYKQIDNYFQERKIDLTSAHPDVYENIDAFKAHFVEFSGLTSNLTEKEKTRAWFQLYGKSKRAIRENFEIKSVKAQTSREINKPKQKITFIHILGVLIAASFGLAFGISSNQSKDAELKEQRKAEKITSQRKTECINSGILFYKANNMYPKLKTRDVYTVDHVTEMCNNNPNAF